jgi:hypothetical protein
MEGRVAAISWARVVLPTWRGPMSATAAWRARAASTFERMARGIIPAN